MNILLFGVSTVGKSVSEKLLASRLNYAFYDLDDEVKKDQHMTPEEFVSTGTLWERDIIRCRIFNHLVHKNENKVIAVTPLPYTKDIRYLFHSSDVLSIELTDYPVLRTVLYQLLFIGKSIPYVSQNQYIDIATMFGFIKNNNGNIVIANRIFESVLYNLFISEEFTSNRMYDAGLQEKNQFIIRGHLDVRKILEKFVETFDYLYGDADEIFLEEAGRRYFMLFLKPIINGIGNSYVESETRNHERMDLVIDYRGEQSIIELKIWRGNAYNERGEEQLSDYLDYFHLKKGYMLSFNFNEKKEIGVKEIILGDKVLIEAVV